MKKASKIGGGGMIRRLAAILLGYVIYVFAAYDRIEDNQELSVWWINAETSVPTELPSISLREASALYDDYSFLWMGNAQRIFRSGELLRKDGLRSGRNGF